MRQSMPLLINFSHFALCEGLADSAILGDAGVFEAGNEHHGSALLLLPDREDYVDGFATRSC